MKISKVSAMDAARAEVEKLLYQLMDHYPLKLTADDLVEMFVPEHLKEMAINGRQHFDIGALTANRINLTLRVDDMKCLLMISTTSNTTPLLPKSPLPFDDDSPRGQILMEWLRFRVDVGKQFAVAQRTVEWLSQNCGSLPQIAFFLPVIQTLLARTEHASGAHALEKLRKAKPPRSLPGLLPWVREGCQVTTIIITAASLLPPFAGSEPEVIPWLAECDNFDFCGVQLRPL